MTVKHTRATDSRESWSGALHGVAQKFKGNRLVAKSVLSQQSDGLVQACTTWAVLVKQVTGKQDKVDLLLTGNLQNLLERVDGVLATDGILFRIADVIVSGEQDAKAALGRTKG